MNQTGPRIRAGVCNQPLVKNRYCPKVSAILPSFQDIVQCCSKPRPDGRGRPNDLSEITIAVASSWRRWLTELSTGNGNLSGTRMNQLSFVAGVWSRGSNNTPSKRNVAVPLDPFAS